METLTNSLYSSACAFILTYANGTLLGACSCAFFKLQWPSYRVSAKSSYNKTVEENFHEHIANCAFYEVLSISSSPIVALNVLYIMCSYLVYL